MAITNQDIVRAMWRASGLVPLIDDSAEHAARITDDPETLMAVAADLRHQAMQMIATVAAPDHSQFGEFKLLLRALVGKAAAPGIVIDAGAHSREASNSYDLITSFGWKGVLIEALPRRAAALRDEFGEGDYQVVECAVGLEPGRQPLWLGRGALITSLSRWLADMFYGQGESIEVEVRRLADILVDTGVPHDFDLLSIDIEGLDVLVFNDLIENSPFRPRFVVIEVMHGFEKRFDELDFSPAVLKDYREIARTLPNLILERA